MKNNEHERTKRPFVAFAWFVIVLILCMPLHISIALAAVQVSSVRVYGNNNVTDIIAPDDTVRMDIEVSDAPSLSTEDVSIRLRENTQNPTFDIQGNPGSCTYDENRSDSTRQFTDCLYSVNAVDFPTDLSYSVTVGPEFVVGTFTKDTAPPRIESPAFFLYQNGLNFSFRVQDIISEVNQDCSGISRIDIVNNDTSQILETYAPNLTNENKTCTYVYDQEGSLGVTLDQSGEHTICLHVFDGVGNRANYCEEVSIDLQSPDITHFGMYRLNLNGEKIGPVRYFSDDPLQNVLVEMNISDQNIRTRDEADSVTGDVWVDLRNLAPENRNPSGYNVSLKCYELGEGSYSCNRVITAGLSPRDVGDLGVTIHAQDAAHNVVEREHQIQAVLDSVGPEIVSIKTENCLASESVTDTCFLHDSSTGGNNKIIARVSESLSGLNEDYFYFDLSQLNPVYTQRVKAYDCNQMSDTVWDCYVYADIPSTTAHMVEKPVSVHFSTMDNAGNTLVQPTRTKLLAYDKVPPSFSNITVTPRGNSQYPQYDGFGRNVVIPYDELEVKFQVSDNDSEIKKVMFDISRFDSTQTGIVNATDCVPDVDKEGYTPGKDFVCTYIIQNAQPPASAALNRFVGLHIVDGAGNRHIESNVAAYQVARFEDLSPDVSTTVSLYHYQGNSPVPQVDKNLLLNELNPSGYKIQIPVRVSGITSVHGIKAETCQIQQILGGGVLDTTINVPIINNPDFYIQGTFQGSQNQDTKLFVANLPPMEESQLENATRLRMNCSISYLVGTSESRIGKDKLVKPLIIDVPLRGSLGQGPGLANYIVDQDLQEQIESLEKWLDTLGPIQDGGLAVCKALSTTLAVFTAVRTIVIVVTEVINLIFPGSMTGIQTAIVNAHDIATDVWECPFCIGNTYPVEYGEALFKNSLSFHNICRAFVCDYTISLGLGQNPSTGDNAWDIDQGSILPPQNSYESIIMQNVDQELQFLVWEGLFDVRNNFWSAMIIPTTIGLTMGIPFPPKAVVYPPCLQGIVNSLEMKHRMLVLKRGCLTANALSHNAFECDRYEKYYRCVHHFGFIGKFTYLIKDAIIGAAGAIVLDSLSKLLYEQVCKEAKGTRSYDYVMCWVDWIVHFFAVVQAVDTVADAIGDLNIGGGDDSPDSDDVANEIDDELGELDL